MSIPFRSMVSAGPNQGFSGIPLFAGEPKSAPGADGGYVTTTGEGYELRSHAPDGRILRLVRKRFPPVSVPADTDDRLDAAADFAAATFPAEAGPSRMYHDGLKPTTDVIAPIHDIYVGDDGTIWVRRVDLAADPFESAFAPTVPTDDWSPPTPIFDVFAPDGRYVGTVETTEWPRAVGDGWMMATVRDDLGVRYVVRYELVER